MAGRGPAPKPDDQRARRNAPPSPTTVLEYRPCPQPELPAGFPWPERTREWWNAWREAPQAHLFSQLDWEFLADTALLHATAWGSAADAVAVGGKIDTSHHAELRIRVAKFGATIEDRLRLRMVFAPSEDKPEPAARRSARDRYSKLRVVPSDPSA